MTYFQFTPFIIPLAIGAILCFWLIGQEAYKKRNKPTAWALLGLAVAAGWWTTFYALEIASVALEAKIFWAKVQYLGIASTPVAWVIFAFTYNGQEKRLTLRNIGLLLIVPIATFLLTITNEWHHLIWTDNVIDESGIFMNNTYGYGFWIYVLFSYLCTGIGCIMLLYGVLYTRSSTFRWQRISVVVGTSVALLANIVTIFKLSPFPGFDLTPLAFTLSITAFFFAMFRFRMFDIVPIAHGAIINSMRDGILVTDLQERIVETNQTALNIMDLSTDQLISQSVKELLPNLATNEDQIPKQTIIEMKLGYKEPKDYEVRVSPLYDYRNKLRGRILILHDITERKRLQQLRDDLTRTMVHDLRSPLGNIASTLQWFDQIIGDQLEPEDQEILQTSYDNANKLLDLVTSILDISRLESKQMPIEKTRFILEDLFLQVASNFSLTAQEKNIKVNIELPAKVPPAYADSRLINRVLQNFVGNALKFTPKGGRVTIKANFSPDNEDKLVVTVQDTGSGIPLAIRDRLFDKFVTGNQAGRGSGVGLAFCKMVIEAHDEEIWVDTSPAGTLMNFTLPTTAPHS